MARHPKTDIIGRHIVADAGSPGASHAPDPPSRLAIRRRRAWRRRRWSRRLVRAVAGAGAGRSERNWRHGLSLFGDLKYPAGFKHFDYVNPRRRRAARVRMIAIGTFDNFNLSSPA